MTLKKLKKENKDKIQTNIMNLIFKKNENELSQK